MSYSKVNMMEKWLAPPPMVVPGPRMQLAEVPAPSSSGWGKKLLIIIAVLVGALILLALISSMTSKKKRIERNPVKRLSTPALAKQLYERLEKRGGANPATLRSLAAYTRKRD